MGKAFYGVEAGAMGLSMRAGRMGGCGWKEGLQNTPGWLRVKEGVLTPESRHLEG